MKLKTFLASYILFLAILFTALGSVSAFMTQSQMNLLREKSIREYHSLTATLARDMALLYQRSDHFHEDLNVLIQGYIRFYSQHQINLDLFEKPAVDTDFSGFELSFLQRDKEHFISIIGGLPEPFQDFQLHFEVNVTETFTELEQIQRMLLVITLIFSVIAAIALYLLLSRLFKPLKIIAQSAQKIAGGQYNERIHIKGKNELATVALDFNRMAEQIEHQILQLEDEATAKQQFVDNFAHEIRTPLTAIFGYAEYIQKAPVTEETLIGLTQHIMNEAKHMENLGTSLLELATTRHYHPIKTTLSIPKLFEEVRQTLEKPLMEKQVQLILQPKLEKMEGQEDLIKSLLLNLVANAIKATHAKQGIIYLKAEPSKEQMIITVQDNGCGIPDSEISKIEEPFFRVDKARNRKDGGAGLGLSLCKQIIEVHHGKLVIESKLGEGTTVKVIF